MKISNTMKNRILFVFVLAYIFTATCQEKEPNLNSQQQKKILNKKTKENMNIYKTPIYRVNFESYLPFELYLNDVLIDKNSSKGSIDIFETLNEYILAPSKQELKIKLYPFPGKPQISFNDIKDITIQIYKSPSLKSETFTLVHQIKFPNFKEELPFYEYKTFFEADDIPYNNTGWKNAKDLTKEKNLLDETILFYENVRTILNNGDYEKYFSINKLADNEIYKSLYLNENEINEDKKNEMNRIINSKGKMKELKGYVLKYYGNGKLIRLEMPDGSSPLCADREDVESYYNFFLYKPLNSNNLMIIR
ncbi:hypothetical protein GQ592_11600 [Gilliamella sp. Lep-s21]|nr:MULTISPECIES: hypothetical protein [unclassified Gilliamella]MWP50382.1 hypothetical protein [Gilliamella sp. Lep-s35]MWP70109.1 hypothetical protein [Gilliamella sp. Lep-s5]MWP78338.1 hypothetical protein [Gilliamella sp. Lep-s21]